MNAESLTEPILALAGAIESRRGGPPTASDPSLDHTPVGTDPLVYQLVYSVLLWEGSHDLAARSLEAVRAEVVDFNELRVCSVGEVSAMLPRECPKRSERVDRLLTALNAIFLREHGLSLLHLQGLPKREARQYLDALPGLPQFAAARILLVSLGGHAFPTDSRIARVLEEAGVIDARDAKNPDLGSKLERAVRAADAPRVYGLLEAEACELPARRSPSRKGAATTPAGDEDPASCQPTSPDGVADPTMGEDADGAES